MDVDDEKKDILQEIAHVGAGNASKALSELTGERIEVEFPSIETMRISDVPSELGGPANVVTSVVLEVDLEDARDKHKISGMGTLLLIFDDESAERLANYLTDENVSGEGPYELTELGESALKETGNILAGSALSAITEYVDLRLVEKIPHLETDMFGALLDNLLLELAWEEDEILVFRTKFLFEEEIDAVFLFLFEPGVERTFLDRLEVG